MNTFSLAEFVDEKEETNASERVAFLLRLSICGCILIVEICFICIAVCYTCNLDNLLRRPCQRHLCSIVGFNRS